MEKRKQKYRKTSKGIGRKIMHTLAARVVIVPFFLFGGNGIERRSWQFNTSLSTLSTSAIQGR